MDGDEVKDEVDNCPTVKNGSQIDTDGDGDGDACDEDDDNDGVLDGSDNCRIDHNPDQTDTDGNGYGDACPPVDSDQDGVINDDDNCDFIDNPEQEDLDGDDKGDVCDTDMDGDRFHNDFDNCPTVYNLEPTDIDGDGLINDQLDRDGDGIGTACDPEEPVIDPPPEPDETPPDVTLDVPRNESLAQLGSGMIVRIGCSEACTAATKVVVNRRIARELDLGHDRVLARGLARLDGEGVTYSFIRTKARRLQGKGGSGGFHATLKTRVTDEADNARELTRRLSLRN